jgi:hypothetical protein
MFDVLLLLLELLRQLESLTRQRLDCGASAPLFNRDTKACPTPRDLSNLHQSGDELRCIASGSPHSKRFAPDPTPCGSSSLPDRVAFC